MSRIAGCATPEGTTRYRDRSVRAHNLPESHFRNAPGALRLSSLGLGTYIGNPDSATDLEVEQAVSVCLSSGRVNVLDTAINYRYQRAERSVGRAVSRAVESKSVSRDEIFVATKNGYFAPDGEGKVPIENWVEVELVKKGILDPADIVDGCHAMSVSYLTDQFGRSRANLGLDTIDLLYLHNAADAQLSVIGREEFERRLGGAFELYERFRSQGKLGAYGLATWDCLRAHRSDPGYLALEDIVRIARDAGGDEHGFRFVQFPFNLGMPEAAVLQNQHVGGERLTLFDAAERLHLGCFTSVPLFQGQLARTGPAADGMSAAQTALQFARSAPGSLGPLVGQKRPKHLAENLKVAETAPWNNETFGTFLP